MFSASYEHAVLYLDRHRNIEPAVYNASRLNEQPVPANDDENNQDRADSPHSELNDENGLNENQHDEQAAPTNDTVMNVSESNNADGFHPDQSPESANIFEQQPEEVHMDQVEEIINNVVDPLQITHIKLEPEILDNYSSNINSVDQLLLPEENDESLQEIVVDDDLTFYVGKSGYAMPTQSSLILVKRQNDAVSGDVAYKEMVICFRTCFHFFCEKMKCFDYILDFLLNVFCFLIVGKWSRLFS